MVLLKIQKHRGSLIRSALLLSGISLASDSLAQSYDAFGLGNKQATSAASDVKHPINSPIGGQASGIAASTSQSKTDVLATTGAALPDNQRTNGSSDLIRSKQADTRTRTSLDIVAPRAQAHIRYALELAERGAVESAQAEFRTALELVADAQDADTKNATRAHARAVKAGLTAIEEAKDFVSADAATDLDTNLSQFLTIHHTPVLKQANAVNLSRAEALQRYHTYATQQLAFAGGNSAIASSALYGLGRAESSNAVGAGVHNPLGGPNAIAFYQAALYVDPQNYIAANELGVLMARYGDLAAAEEQLIRSLTIHPQPEAWHNLAAVYRNMGQHEKATQAEQEREKLLAASREAGTVNSEAGGVAGRPMLRWVDSETFAATGTPYGLDGPAINSSTSNKAVASAQPSSLGKRLMSKLVTWPKSNKVSPTENETQQPSQQDYLSRGGNLPERQMYK